MINCRDAVEKLYSYLDRQLSDEEAAEVRQHLDRCPHCEDHFRFEENVLTRVHDVCREVQTPSNLLERVRSMCTAPRSDA